MEGLHFTFKEERKDAIAEGKTLKKQLKYLTEEMATNRVFTEES
jgi:hypothetical protein